MPTIRAHRIRLNPTPEQVAYFKQAAGTRRFVYNWGLAEWGRQYQTGGKPSAQALKTQFNTLKRAQFPWVYVRCDEMCGGRRIHGLGNRLQKLL